uniref:Uncharacterized protein n=1 Tax=Klebsiella pneumoniae TaxID=573 RepID=A0A6G9HVM0_KLEPN|nr:hypothetical protein [Klebsiella pneumoniae]
MNTATSCVFWTLRVGGAEADPELAFFGSFPEVYHGQGISKAAFSGGERPVTGEGRDTTYSVILSWEHRYILCCRAAARRSRSGRSGTTFFRISEVEKRNYCSMDTKNE